MAQRYALAMSVSPRALTALLIMVLAARAGADDAKPPYWASIRSEAVNMRVGPGEDYRIQWVYHRRLLPLRVLRMREAWRLVEDPEGAKGWVLSRMLSRERGGLVTGQGLADMREKADGGSRLLWRLEPGVTGKLGDCSAGWCKFQVEGRVGFAPQDRLWGSGAP
jgi:SH3-like domain-containing protein